MEPKKEYKTYQFSDHVALTTARRGAMTVPEHVPVAIGAPPVFKGTPDVWCPEELLLGAVNSCLMQTFLTYAHHRHLGITSCESNAEGSVENVEGNYQITRIVVKPVIGLSQPGETALAEEVLKSAREGCFLSNSVKATVVLQPQFTAGAGEPIN